MSFALKTRFVCTEKICIEGCLYMIAYWHSQRKIYTFCFSFWSFASAANLFGLQIMGIDSFVALRWPMKHNIYMRQTVVSAMILTAWTISAIITFCYPVLLFSNIHQIRLTDGPSQFCRSWYIYYVFDKTSVTHLFNFDINATDVFNRWQFISIISLTTALLLLIYGYRSYVVRKVARHWNNHQLQNTTLTPTDRAHHVRKVERKGYRITIVLYLTFLVLWIPCLTMQFLKVKYPSLNITHLGDLHFGRLERICHTICCLTTILDVFVYLIFMRSREMCKWFLKAKSSFFLHGKQTN